MTRPLFLRIAISLALALPAGAATESQDTDILQQALTSKNPDTRKMGVVALSLAASAGPLFDTLAGMLDDKDVEVRLAVVLSLAEVKTLQARKTLERMLADTVPEVAFAAAKALYAIKDPPGKQALLAVLEGETKTNSNYFSQQMRQAIRMMHTPKVTLLYAVRQGAGFVPLPGFGMGISSLQAILADNGVSGRATAALLLGGEKDAATAAALRDALNDKDWRVRAAAVSRSYARSPGSCFGRPRSAPACSSASCSGSSVPWGRSRRAPRCLSPVRAACWFLRPRSPSSPLPA